MKLVELIQEEQEGLPREGILLLRHATAQIEMLERFGVSLQEYTAIQPIGGRYDFYLPSKPRTEVVVAIVRDYVHAVYRITGVLDTGNGTDICTPEYRKFELYRQEGKAKPRVDRVCRRYSLVAVQSGSDGVAVSGWSGKERMPVQRSDDKFFDQLEVFAAPIPKFSWGSSSFDSEWAEGASKLRLHLMRERAPGLSAAKKRAFVAERGRLFCERCASDPVEAYGLVAAEACIEVHHAATAVSEMKDGHATKLSDLQCLCANCHRLVHALGRH